MHKQIWDFKQYRHDKIYKRQIIPPIDEKKVSFCIACLFLKEKKIKYAVKCLKFYPDSAVQSSVK